MGVSRKMLINTVVELFTAPLGQRGYSFRELSPVMGNDFWFEKPAQFERDKYRIIEFQPSGFSDDNLFDLAVNLIKGDLIKDFSNRVDSETDIFEIKKDYVVRLSPRIWDENSTVMDYWWHFTSTEQLIHICLDILDKIIMSGIPFLEDDSKTFKDWLPP